MSTEKKPSPDPIVRETKRMIRAEIFLLISYSLDGSDVAMGRGDLERVSKGSGGVGRQLDAETLIASLPGQIRRRNPTG